MLTFAFTVDAVGDVTGTATDEGIAGTKALSGRAGDRHNGCSKDGTTLELAIADSTIVGRLLSAFRTSRGSLTGTYAANLYNVPGHSVVVTKAVP